MSDDKPNYKETVNLPQTDFPMRASLVEREPERLAAWNESDLYGQIQKAHEGQPKFILHDGTPFANGDVHMGTALNKVLKDFIVKSRTMAGFECPYIPGWDCHGLPIEFKVVREAKELSPVEVRKRSEELARSFVDIQRNSFRRLGVLGDWDNPYLTLDPAYESDIIRTFAKCVEKGLVYQSRRPVLWSYGAGTALAEAEVEYKDKTSPAVYVKFALTDGGSTSLADEGYSAVIWTTTPWTLPANTGIALRSNYDYVAGTFTADDGRSEKLIVLKSLLGAFSEGTGLTLDDSQPSTEVKGEALKGGAAQHPFLDRISKIINADFVTDETGTGSVHVAPGHGQDDYIAGLENGLDLVSPVDDGGLFTAESGLPDLVGTHVFKGNAAIIEMLRESGHLLGDYDYKHSYPHCWRSKTPIIFRAVEQFFIRIDDIRSDALAEIDKVQWLPAATRNRIHGTVESRPDWCISRQRTWGVPLPVFYSPEGEAIVDPELANRVADVIEEHGTNLWFDEDDAQWCARLDLPEGTRRSRDTLDVWIDSGCSHAAVLDRRPELSTPADVYLEATDQHRGWFQSSLMMSLIARGSAPYKTVITHGFVVDGDSGQKISKSDQAKKGKKAKPTDAEHFVSNYGADILRLWCASVDYRAEVPFSEKLFSQTSESYRRLRNTLRILLGNLHDFDPKNHPDAMAGATLIDRWVLERLHVVTADCLAGYEAYDFRKVFNAINQFCASDLSALYIDITKDRMYCDAVDSPRRRATQAVMHRIAGDLCRLLAPILAYTADEAWEEIGDGGSVHLQDFPEPDPAYAPGAEAAASPLVDKLYHLREVMSSAIEGAVQAKEFKKRNEAAVELTVAEAELPGDFLDDNEDALEFFIVGDFSFKVGEATSATARKADLEKCPRCWRHRHDIGTHPSQPELCGRCGDALS